MKPTLLGKITLLILAIGVAVGVWRILPKSSPATLIATNNQTSATGPAITIKGRLGGEKEGLLADEQVKSLLKSKYGITVQSERFGSLEMARSSTAGQDFLWPSSQIALEIYKARKAPLISSEVLLNTPLVMYSWAGTTNALLKQGIVQQISGSYYIVDMAKLVSLMTRGAHWKDIGLADFNGPIVVQCTDPSRSNSGMTFACLMAGVLNSGTVPNLAAIPKVQPPLRNFFSRIGYLQPGSGDLFEQYVQQGEGAYPIIVGYENQMIEYALKHPENQAALQKEVRVLYPRPTAWSAHPFIALTANGDRLKQALKDPELQKLAWERHGFRGSAVSENRSIQGFGAIPPRITNVMPLPAPAVAEALVKGLGG